MVEGVEWLVIVAVVLVVGGLALAYNAMVRRRVRVREAWAQIDVQLQRRHDLIPGLVATVKGYATHESQTLDALTAARTAAVRAQASHDPAVVGRVESELENRLASLFVAVEGYPQLRAADAFGRLQEELVATQDKIAYARHFYNTSVRDLNTSIETLPGSLWARPLGFTPASYLEIDAAARIPAVVDLGDDDAVAGGEASAELPRARPGETNQTQRSGEEEPRV